MKIIYKMFSEITDRTIKSRRRFLKEIEMKIWIENRFFSLHIEFHRIKQIDRLFECSMV